MPLTRTVHLCHASFAQCIAPLVSRTPLPSACFHAHIIHRAPLLPSTTSPTVHRLRFRRHSPLLSPPRSLQHRFDRSLNKASSPRDVRACVRVCVCVCACVRVCVCACVCVCMSQTPRSLCFLMKSLIFKFRYKLMNLELIFKEVAKQQLIFNENGLMLKVRLMRLLN